MALIELQKVSKIFGAPPQTITALREVDMQISAGEVFGIIGRSGAGKSTLIRCLNRLEEPTSGKVTVAGVDLAKLSDRELRYSRRGIGMVFQHFNLLASCTALENIAFPLLVAGETKKNAIARANELLELVDLADKARVYPAQLSGGQKQRVGIARALANRPQILLCDEATSALDPQTTREILVLIKTLSAQLNLTVVLITHEMAVITEICGRVAVMERGKVIETGSVFDVFTHPQWAITRHFVESVLRRDDDTSFYQPRGKLWRVLFMGQSAEDSLLAEIVRRFAVNVNIRSAHIMHLQNLGCGTALIDLSGEESACVAAIDYLRQCGQNVERYEPLAFAPKGDL